MSGPSLKFGTSGLRGLVVDLVGDPTRLWVGRFLRHLEATGQTDGRTLLVGRDLRSSSPQIAADAIETARRLGWQAVDCGALPTPALALDSLRRAVPAVMITGSHIPDDRNGLKFYRPDGEIGKADEAAILAIEDPFGSASAGESGTVVADGTLIERYLARYTRFFAPDALEGLSVGIYQHSTVARDVLVAILDRLGARTEAFGRSDAFLPVDTEAHRPEDVVALRTWGGLGRFDAIVSADGDADRPLVADEHGTILRGDILGLLTAQYLGLSTVVTPVTSSSAMEKAAFLTGVRRTRVGSPFVIAGMNDAIAAGERVIGFEANGGVLLGSVVERDGRRIEALATRDALLPILSLLADAKRRGTAVSRLVADLGAGAAASDRLAEIDMAAARRFIDRLESDGAYRDAVLDFEGGVASVNTADGVRMTTRYGSTVHFRPSGNAPELRCYVEAASQDEAQTLLARGLGTARVELLRHAG
ncbi:phosphomannomutase [Aureimonas sp. AU4]|uniref:phosphomannomutase n=1 Tax=Aureimonas sp. AU4 TaxID=1638163 RepID=UPI000782727D|nr:phosphomannomutase [Aureimonas sp. AU4]